MSLDIREDRVGTIVDEGMSTTIDDDDLGARERGSQPMAHCEWTDWIGVAPQQ
jgi:hypothetical protein